MIPDWSTYATPGVRYGGPRAGVAELVDAPDLGSGERELVEVRVLSPALRVDGTAMSLRCWLTPSRPLAWRQSRERPSGCFR